MNLRRFAVRLAMAVTLATGAILIGTLSFPVLADSWSTNFESFTLTSVNGQDGWSCTGPFDQSVVANTYGYPSFGAQTFRISDGITSGSFGDQTFTKSLTNEAGEADATNDGYSGGVRQTHFEAQFDIASTTSVYQPGMHVSVSPDRGDGARMSYLRFDDLPDGIHVYFIDVTDPGHVINGESFNETDIATINRTAPHTVKFVIEFVDGPDNDVVRIYVDGALKITGTTWEDYFRFDTESNPLLEVHSRTVDSLLFREGGDPDPGNLGMGFLFDNFTAESSSPSASLSMGPQAMEGDLRVYPGDTLKVGYDFTMPGSHPAATITFGNPQVTFQYTCVSGPGSGTFIVSMPDASYTDPQNSSAWYPSGDQRSPLVFQELAPVPDVCGGGLVRLQRGGTFTSLVGATGHYKVNIRWHYSANGSAGGWSGTKSVTP